MEKGLLREYSAWAVALGAADAWERAMEASSVSPVELSHRPAPHLQHGPVVEPFDVPPSSSVAVAAVASAAAGSAAAGSAAVLGGSVGGGGGGGSSGSW